MGEQAVTCFGQTNASRGAREEWSANSFFKAAYRLTDCRWSHTEMPRGGSEAAKLGYGEEHDQAIQMRSLD